VKLAPPFPKYRVTTQKDRSLPMFFYQHLTTFQVETKSSSTTFPYQNEADILYQKYVKDKIPVEFFKNGKLQKEFKP